MPKGIYTRPRPAPNKIQDDGSIGIPLCARDGSIRAYAIIDAADATWISQWRWSLNEGYARRNVWIQQRVRHIYLHRELLGLKRGNRLKGDHIDRDKLNCRRSNLRIVPHVGNMQNVPSHAGSSSSFRGVHWDKAHQKWQAQINTNGKSTYIGLFENEADAAEAARDARQRLMSFAVD